MFHTRDHHGQYRNWGETGQEGQSLLGNGLGISQGLVSGCSGHHLSFLGFILVSVFVISILIVVILLFYFISIIKRFLSQPLGVLFFWFPSPSQGCGGISSSCVVLS